MSDPTQSGGATAGGASGQQATDVGGNVRQMSVGDLLDLAVQQNVDVSAMLDVLNDLNLSPDVNIGTRTVNNPGAGDPPASVQ